MTRTLSRKEFLALGAAPFGASLVAACDLFTTEPAEEDGEGRGSAANGKEAPELAEQVADGSLPPVEERLPDNPLVVEPVERIGRYGGTWNTGILGTVTGWIIQTVRYDHLVMWDFDWAEPVANVAESFEILGDGREYVFQLREGMKWSDGEPFTADDIMFWYDAMLNNEELTPVVSTTLMVADEPVVVEKLDDYRVKFVFAQPYGLLLPGLADFDPAVRLLPRHYLEQFHKDFNPDVDQLVEEAGVPDWVELFWQQADLFNNTELPTIRGWQVTEPLSGGQRVVFERNPYYWKVDSEGSQLPYIDKIVYDVFGEEEVMVLRASNGEIDMHARDPLAAARNRPVLARSMEQGGYRLLDMTYAYHNTMGICLNLTHEDPQKREMFQNRDFRIGLSHAINRQEIIDLVWQSQGEPWQTAPRPEAPFYESDDIGKQYTEFDLELANEHLDRAGYTERNGDGMRLGPNGEPISVSVMMQSRYFEHGDALELMTHTWAEAGIELRIDNLDISLFGERMESREFDCALDIGEYGYLCMLIDPRWLFATAGSSYAPLWSNWYEGGDPQEEPPEPMRRQAEIYETEVRQNIDGDVQFAGMRQIIEIARDEFWSMGISLPPDPVAIVKNNFRNVPDNMWLAGFSPGYTHITQYFIEEE